MAQKGPGAVESGTSPEPWYLQHMDVACPASLTRFAFHVNNHIARHQKEVVDGDSRPVLRTDVCMHRMSV